MKKKISFEASLQQLELIVTKLEEGSLDLEESMNAFEEGIKLSRTCQQFLEKAEKRIEIIMKSEKGDYEQIEFELEN
ncbi:MAG: exodeoxyribonuclease VII small subunit [SAR324 cluster bacterium]|nr:exodeoxyribonuclease VII small subunit [SAR324 cluster bacterium]